MGRAVAAASLTVLAAAFSYALLALLGPDWTLFAPANCLASHCFCEAARDGALVLQPANSWSSFGFALVGFWIMLPPGGVAKSGVFSGWLPLWFGLTSVVIGAGSFLMHATLTLWGQFADVLGMYLLGGFILVYAAQRWLSLPSRAGLALYLALSALLILLLWAMPEVRRWLFALLLGAAIVVELMLARPRRPSVQSAWLGYALLFYVAAFAIWLLDNSHTLCAPDAPLQGHALWHLLGAISVYCTYRYYRSEDASPARATSPQRAEHA